MTAPNIHLWTDSAHAPDPSARPVEVAIAIALVALAMVLRWAPSRAGGSALQDAGISPAAWASTARRLTRRQVLGAVFTGTSIALFIGGPGGLFCGLLSTIGALVFGSRRHSERETRAQLRLVAAAPPVVDLFAAGLAAGLLPVDAAAATATAYNASTPPETNVIKEFDAKPPTPQTHLSRLTRLHPSRLIPRPKPAIDPTHEIAERFATAAHALRQGADAETAWRPLSVDGATAPVGAAALRASRTGAPAAETVAKAARDLWNAAEQAANAQLRAAVVRSAAPLALCFLPAFVLVGIVPTALGLLVELRP